MTRQLYLGLDLTTSSRIPTAYGVLDGGLELVDLGLLGTDQEILECGRRLNPTLVAIDAPLFLPLGLCCLEEACPCRQLFPLPGRRAERALRNEGISAYPVTKRTFIKTLVCRGRSLTRSLRGEGFEVIEVYPYASQVRLFGKPLLPRRLAPARALLRQSLLELFPSLAVLAPRPSLDHCDAILAAYTAYLYRGGVTEAIGDEREGVTHVPRKK